MSSSYFNKLNYTLANEDSSVEMAMVPRGAAHVVAVAGSGARGLALLQARPGRLTLIDIAPEQLLLTELRVETMRAFRRDEYLAFWGYPPCHDSAFPRRKILGELNLRPAARHFFTDLFRRVNDHSILYLGRWEQTFRHIAGAIDRLCGGRQRTLFQATNLSRQNEIFTNEFPRLRFRLATLLLGNGAVFNGLLYKGTFPKLNLASSHFRYYHDAFARLFQGSLARENFFLQIVLLGGLTDPAALPVECQPGIYEELRAALTTTKVEYVIADAVSWLNKAKAGSIDFVSLSDLASYFDGDLERSFLQQMRPSLRPGAIVVNRSYLKRPEGADRTGFVDVSAAWSAAIQAEKTQMYAIQALQRA